MFSPDKNIIETNISGAGVIQSGIYGTECPALLDRGIFGVGCARIAGPYHIVRLNPDFEHITYCFEGKGDGLIDGEWVPFGQGDIVFAPRLASHGSRYNPKAKRPWGLAWIIFDRNRNPKPRLHLQEATIVRGGYASPLPMIEGLEQEVVFGRDAVTIGLWIELIVQWVARLLARKPEDERLRRLWQEVQRNLASSWSLADMASEAGLSEGHLRRLCREQLGTSPRSQLARLRIRKTSVLLSTTDRTLEAIAEEVGYSDPFALSTAFRRLTGCSPREFRRSLSGP